MKKQEKPLSGHKILITRSEEQALPFVHAIEGKGGEAILIPLLSFEPPQNMSDLKQAIRNMNEFQWIVFTSQNAVRFFLDCMDNEGKKHDVYNSCKIAAIGIKTYKLLEERGLNVDFYPSEYIAEQFAMEFLEQTKVGDKILLPQGNLARSTIYEILSERGRDVQVVTTYETVANRLSSNALQAVVYDRRIDIVTFTSSSTVHFFFELLGEKVPMDSCLTACIGPITAQTLEKYGYSADIIAEEYTMDGLVESIESHILKEEEL